MSATRASRCSREGRGTSVSYTHLDVYKRQFELPGDEVILYRDGDRLIMEPVKKKMGLLELLASWEPIEEDFPDVDEGLLPLDNIQL